MASSRFVNVSDEDPSQFLEENENKLLPVKSQIVFIHEFLIPYRERASLRASELYGIKNW